VAQKTPPKSKNADARARAQARREEIRRQEQRRKLGIYGLSGVLGLVVILVVVFIAVNVHDTKTGSANVTQAAPASVAADITTIPESAFASAGVKGVGTSVAGISTISGGTPILTNGLPTLVYVGGEFCPYCAAERWAIASAVSRFGTLSGLQITQSSGTDEDPNTATLSFVTTKFSGKYLAFVPTEQEDRAEKPLDTPPAAELASFTKYGGQAYPFVSINNQYKASVQYDPGLLKGLTAVQIAADIKNAQSPVGQDILASANVLTAGICESTKDQPAAVCNSSEVAAARQYLNTTTSTSGSSSAGG
jgi:hypothetical protein